MIGYWFYVRYTAPGTSFHRYMAASYVHAASIAELTGTIRPVLGPVRNITVGGQPAGVPLTGVGTTPIVSWDPPALGTPTHYRISMERLYESSTGTAWETRARFTTTGTSVVVPPGCMGAGQVYVLRISAIATPGLDVRTTPFHQSFPMTQVTALTATIAP